MYLQIVILWNYLRARADMAGGRSDAGTVVETVILTALFAAMAISIAAIILAKVTDKAHAINLNGT